MNFQQSVLICLNSSRTSEVQKSQMLDLSILPISRRLDYKCTEVFTCQPNRKASLHSKLTESLLKRLNSYSPSSRRRVEGHFLISYLSCKIRKINKDDLTYLMLMQPAVHVCSNITGAFLFYVIIYCYQLWDGVHEFYRGNDINESHTTTKPY